MGTVSDKLTYLNTTKGKIKDSINKFRNGITNQTTFRNYVTELDGVYDLLPKIDNTDEELELLNVQNGKLDEFKMYGNTEQTTYSGKNLLAYTSYGEEKQGVTTTYDSEDGALILNGTANNTFSNLTKESSIDIATGTYTFSIEEAKNYNIRLAITCTDNTTINATINKGSTSITFNVNKATLNQRIFIYENDTLSGTTFTNEKIYAQLESGSTPTNFEKYVGGYPSPSPDFPQQIEVVTGNNTIKVTGKNLFDKNNVTNGYRLGSDGLPYEDSGYSLSDFIKVEPDSTYYRNITFAWNVSVCLYDKNKDFITRLQSGNTVATTDTTYYLRTAVATTDLDTVQLEKGSTATTYEPYQGSNYTLNLGTIELCKIGDYKDYIYKNNGNWYKHSEIGKIILDGSENWGLNQYGFFQCSVSNSTSDSSKRNGYCNNFTYAYNTKTDNTFFMVDNLIRIKYNTYDSTTTFKTWLSTHNTIVYYVLATPTTTEITDTTLITQLEAISVFTGTNYFTISNLNNVLPNIYLKRLKQLDKLS